MPNPIQNITQWRSTLIGVIIIVAVLTEVYYFHHLHFLWGGLAGVVTGSMFFIVPDAFITIVLNGFKMLFDNIVSIITKTKP